MGKMSNSMLRKVREMWMGTRMREEQFSIHKKKFVVVQIIKSNFVTLCATMGCMASLRIVSLL